jgi:hypothetical protein
MPLRQPGGTHGEKVQNPKAFCWNIGKMIDIGLVDVIDIHMIPQRECCVKPYDRIIGKIQTSIANEIEVAAKRIKAKHIHD